jgi:hypothetical protein
MIIEPLLKTLHLKPGLSKLLLGSVLAALSVCCGTAGALRLLGMPADPVIPSLLASLAAALYAARARS